MLHDMRTLKPLQRFKGAQNTRANFVRASFAHNSLIASGSEDGTVLLWDEESSECLQTLTGHGDGVVYCAVRISLRASEWKDRLLTGFPACTALEQGTIPACVVWR